MNILLLLFEHSERPLESHPLGKMKLLKSSFSTQQELSVIHKIITEKNIKPCVHSFPPSLCPPSHFLPQSLSFGICVCFSHSLSFFLTPPLFHLSFYVMEIASFPFLMVMIKGLCTCSGRINGGNAEASIYANKYSLLFCLQKQACNSEKLPFK